MRCMTAWVRGRDADGYARAAVVNLVEEVVSGAAGKVAAAAVMNYLQVWYCGVLVAHRRRGDQQLPQNKFYRVKTPGCHLLSYICVVHPGRAAGYLCAC